MQPKNSKRTEATAAAFDAAWKGFNDTFLSERPSGDGWKDVHEIGKMIDRCSRQARDVAEKKVARGEWERISHNGKRGQLQNFYRPILKK